MQKLVDWKIVKDPKNLGIKEGWENACYKTAKNAVVPGIIQQHYPGYNGLAWYWTKFDSNERRKNNRRCVIRFESVDYMAKVWVNGKYAGMNQSPESPFEFDITELVNTSTENLVAVRVLNPTQKAIDGIELKYTPHCNRTDKDFMPGRMLNVGGMTGPVTVYYPPAVRITDVHIQPDPKTGAVTCNIAVENVLGRRVDAELSYIVTDSFEEQYSNQGTHNISCSQGSSVHRILFTIDDYHLWQLEDPCLYTINATLKVNGKPNLADVRNSKFGFREFKIQNGYFYLNGKRIFIRSTHTGNHYPEGVIVAQDKKLVQRDLVNAKACGLNMVRFIAKAAMPEQLEFCDKIGLLVYQETMAAWEMENSEQMADNFDRSVTGMILRDRNHPSVVIWGLLNETLDTPVFRHAPKMLALVRNYDRSRMVLLNSGRLDHDPSIGSFSNPFSDKWEHQWGLESAKPQKHKGDPSCSYKILCDPMNQYAGAMDTMGDIHIYPRFPQLEPRMQKIRQIGNSKRSGPVFISEYGMGSLFHAINELRGYRQNNVNAGLLDYRIIETMVERFLADWTLYGMDDVYPFPQDLLTASRVEHLKERRYGYDLIRSNPFICGYSLTGMLDHGFVGEGIWSFVDRRFKEGIFDVIQDGCASLKWCLFAWPKNIFVGRRFEIEAILANEDILRPGHYQTSMAISKDQETVWRKNVSFEIKSQKGMPPLASPVAKEKIQMASPGKYQLSVSFDAAHASCIPLEFHVTAEVEKLLRIMYINTVGVSGNLVKWLEQKNVKCNPIRDDCPNEAKKILIAANSKVKQVTWNKIIQAVRKGATAIFISPEMFEDVKFSLESLGFKTPLVAKKNMDWLYHKEFVARKHPVFDGLCKPGIMDMNYFGPILGQYRYDNKILPDTIIATAFIMGYVCPCGYDSGILAGEYKIGKGKIVCSAFDILDNVKTHPAAGKMLMNYLHL